MPSYSALFLFLVIALVTLQIQTEGFSSLSLQKSKPFASRTFTDERKFMNTLRARLNDEDENVNVFEVKDVDALNLTVIGFGKYDSLLFSVHFLLNYSSYSLIVYLLQKLRSHSIFLFWLIWEMVE